jgi:DNA adenine methylase
VQRTLFPDSPPAPASRRAGAFRPLLKWPGGKAREWDEIARWLPGRVRDFVDPFAGGGAPFAGTPFDGRAFLNDRHARLVDLHGRVQQQDPHLLAALAALSGTWDRLGRVANDVLPTFTDLVDAHREGRRPDRAAAAGAVRAAATEAAPDAVAAIAESVLDKAGRLARLETRHDVEFSREQLPDHCETAVRAGFYTFVRERENAACRIAPDEPTAESTADFLFVREFCYGSMFRHNAAGDLNIPYGGISYNRKSLRTRLDQFRAPATVAALRRAEFSCEDFESFLARLRPRLGADDLVFADPPYDSDFRSYGPDAFGPDDHRRLAASLATLPCPWVLVIKETDFVRATYLSPAMRAAGTHGVAREVHAFGKEYGYNVRGRNERATRHLVVANFDPPPRS